MKNPLACRTNHNVPSWYDTDERYNAVTAEWRAAREKLEKRLVANKIESNRYDDGLWAGVAAHQTSRFAGMRGLMAAPNGRINGLPILSNFREGLSVLKCSYLLTVLVRVWPMRLKTADSGYASSSSSRRCSRSLGDYSLKMTVVQTAACSSTSITEGKEMIESLEERLNGRYTKKTVKHPETGAVIIGPNRLITEDKARGVPMWRGEK